MMICQACGVEAETKYVSFHQNIGALILRFSRSIDGNLCKNCIHKHFWSMTLTTLALGWWGVISFIISPFLILNNVIRYLFCLGMPAVPPDSVPPELTDEAVERISPYANEIFSKLKDGETLQVTAASVAEKAGVTPGQIALFIHAVIESQSKP